MMKRTLLLLTFMLLCLAALAATPAVPSLPAQGPVLLQRTGSGVAFAVLMPHDGVDLRVATPNGTVFQRSFRGLDSPVFSLTDERGLFRGDGQYVWEIQLTPLLGPSAKREMAEARERGDEAALSDLRRLYLPPYALTYSGAFRVERGSVLYDPNAVEPGEAAASAVPAQAPAPGDDGRPVRTPSTGGGGPQPLDVVHADDVIITGSACMGYDCLIDGTENFGFDSLRLKENNNRIGFMDTSLTAGFATRDWRLRANESPSGGRSAFFIDDMGDVSTGGETPVFSPFAVEAGAPTNSLYITSLGRIGIKTAAPVLNLHLVHGDTPGMRLDQDTSSGWTAQTWDLAGNESNFFVRDVTGGSRLPFRIQPGTPTNTLTMKSDGRVGMGTWSPLADLEITRTGAEVSLLLNRTDGTPWIVGNTPDGLVLNPGTTTSSNVFRLGATGDLLLSGVLTQGSSREIKSTCAAFGPSLLDAVSQLPVLMWSYTADASAARHASPMAEDFYRLFGLGADERHLAPSDLAGVTLAAVQELIRAGEEKDAQIEALSKKNAELAERLARLEAVVLQSGR